MDSRVTDDLLASLLSGSPRGPDMAAPTAAAPSAITVNVAHLQVTTLHIHAGDRLNASQTPLEAPAAVPTPNGELPADPGAVQFPPITHHRRRRRATS